MRIKAAETTLPETEGKKSMRRIWICILLAAAAVCAVLPECFWESGTEETQLAEPVESLAWWSLTCELPNPDKLPVRVRFEWLKGLE